MARGELLGAFALSEPEAGSDAASLRTQAVRDGDDWILNGTKAWVSSGTKGDVILAMARTDTPDDRRGARGIGAFIVTPDLPGFSVGKKEDKMGLRASPTVQLHFADMRVPGDRLLGDVGQRLHLRDAVARQRAARHRRAGDRHRRGRAASMPRRTPPSASSSASRSRNSRRSSSSSPTWRRASPRRARCCTPRRPRRIAASTSRSSARWPSCSRARRRCG